MQFESPPSTPGSSSSFDGFSNATPSAGGGRKASVSLQLFKQTTVRTEDPKQRRPNLQTSQPNPNWSTVLEGAVLSPTNAGFKGKGREILSPHLNSNDPSILSYPLPKSPYKSISRSPHRVHSPSPTKRSRSPNLNATSLLSNSRPVSPRPSSSSTLRTMEFNSGVPEFVLPKAALSPTSISNVVAHYDSNLPTLLDPIAPFHYHSNSVSLQEALPEGRKVALYEIKIGAEERKDGDSTSPPLDAANSNSPSGSTEVPELENLKLIESLKELLTVTKSSPVISPSSGTLTREEEGLFSTTDDEGTCSLTESEDADDWTDGESDSEGEEYDDEEEGEEEDQDNPNFAYSVNVDSLENQLGDLQVGPDESEASGMRRSVTVPLEPFDHQVGGHSHIFRFSKKAVCKVSSSS